MSSWRKASRSAASKVSSGLSPSQVTSPRAVSHSFAEDAVVVQRRATQAALVAAAHDERLKRGAVPPAVVGPVRRVFGRERPCLLQRVSFAEESVRRATAPHPDAAERPLGVLAGGQPVVHDPDRRLALAALVARREVDAHLGVRLSLHRDIAS